MTTPPLPQLKKALATAGFEIFRTRNDEIVLAERVRENLILDSGVRLRVSTPLEVRVVLRAQKTDFPADEEHAFFSRVRKLAATVLHSGFAEVSTAVTPVVDPGDPQHTLDTHYEILFSKQVDGFESALLDLANAIPVQKTVSKTSDLG